MLSVFRVPFEKWYSTDRGDVSIYFYCYCREICQGSLCFASRRGDSSCCRWWSWPGAGKGSWDGILQSGFTGVCPASEAALQWGVKGSCVPKLWGLPVAGGTQGTPRNMSSFKARDSQVLRVQHSPIWEERQKRLRRRPFASAQSSGCNVFSCPAGAAGSEDQLGALLAAARLCSPAPCAQPRVGGEDAASTRARALGAAGLGA